MKLENFVPLGRPLSSQAIIQVMTKFVVFNNQKPFRHKQSNWFILTIKNCMSQCVNMLKTFNQQYFKYACDGIFVKNTLCSLY